jgi:hypothetical protein
VRRLSVRVVVRLDEPLLVLRVCARFSVNKEGESRRLSVRVIFRLDDEPLVVLRVRARFSVNDDGEFPLKISPPKD